MRWGWLLAIVVLAACDADPRDVVEAVNFQRHVIDPTPWRGRECCVDVLATGDIDGDGALDVVIGSEHASKAGLVWYRAPSWEQIAIARGNFTTDGRVADVDGDGDTDVVVSEIDRGLLWFENRGGGAAWIEHSIGGGYAHDVVVGDLDGDSRLDIATADKHRVEIWLQRDSSWARRSLLERDGEGLALADLNGDGRRDVLYSSLWLAAPEKPQLGEWAVHELAPGWPAAVRVASADLNGDGRLDVVLSASEGAGRLSWFESPEDPRVGSWRENVIDPGPLVGAHSLQLSDVNGDGLTDVIAAEMHGTPESRILVYLRDTATHWQRQIVSRRGSHNLRAVDLDGDGDVDLVGKRSGGMETPIEWWQNLSADLLSLDRWTYCAIEHDRSPAERESMGLFLADLDADGRLEVVAGSRIYSLGADSRGLGGKWRSQSLGQVDLYAKLDVDGDESADLVGMRDTELLWYEKAGPSWRERSVATVAMGRTQGFATGDVIAGGRPELVFTRGKGLYLAEIPNQPAGREPWRVTRISSDSEEEGVALGDLDRDGDLDVTTHAADGHRVLWYVNPGRREPTWQSHTLWHSDQWLDRMAIADVNRDGRLDIVVTQESSDWEVNSGIFWLQAPVDPVRQAWSAHEIARLRSVNSLALADLDGDGDVDVVTAEHTDQVREAGAIDNLTVIYENQLQGRSWRAHVVERGGHSSHLGIRVGDLDGDADLDIVSIGWMQYRPIHLWENLAVPRAVCEGR